MRMRSGMIWGGGIMLVASLAGTLFGPSPLVLPFVPLISLSWSLASHYPGLFDAGLQALDWDRKLLFIIWSTSFGVIAGWCVALVFRVIFGQIRRRS